MEKYYEEKKPRWGGFNKIRQAIFESKVNFGELIGHKKRLLQAKVQHNNVYKAKKEAIQARKRHQRFDQEEVHPLANTVKMEAKELFEKQPEKSTVRKNGGRFNTWIRNKLHRAKSPEIKSIPIDNKTLEQMNNEKGIVVEKLNKKKHVPHKLKKKSTQLQFFETLKEAKGIKEPIMTERAALNQLFTGKSSTIVTPWETGASLLQVKRTMIDNISQNVCPSDVSTHVCEPYLNELEIVDGIIHSTTGEPVVLKDDFYNRNTRKNELISELKKTFG